MEYRAQVDRYWNINIILKKLNLTLEQAREQHICQEVAEWQRLSKSNNGS
jgi:hypothetical protein